MFALLSSKIKMFAIAGVAATGLAAGSQAANARDNLRVNLSFAPVFVAPAPVCVEQPLVIAPAYVPAPVCAPVVVDVAPTVVYETAPYRFYRPERVYFHDFHGFHDRRR